MKKRINVLLPDELLKKIDDNTSLRGMSQSGMIRRGLELLCQQQVQNNKIETMREKWIHILEKIDNFRGEIVVMAEGLAIPYIGNVCDFHDNFLLQVYKAKPDISKIYIRWDTITSIELRPNGKKLIEKKEKKE